MEFNLDTTYGYNNDIHKSKIIKNKPNKLATLKNYLLLSIYYVWTKGEVLTSIYQGFFIDAELTYKDFISLSNEVCLKMKSLITLSMIYLKKNINGNLRIKWDEKVL